MASSSQVCDCVHEHGWDSAFYRFAESIRDLTCGGCNHKHIYALVGTRGRYINHTNPIVRKRTAAALSRLMHSSRYAADMRKGYADDSSVFSQAATSLIEMLRNATDLDDAGLFDYVLHTSWPELLRGLESERRAGREIDPLRMACESREVVRWGEQQVACGRAPPASSWPPVFAPWPLDAWTTVLPARCAPVRPKSSKSRPIRATSGCKTAPVWCALPTGTTHAFWACGAWTRTGLSRLVGLAAAMRSRPTRWSRACTAVCLCSTTPGF